MRSKIKVALAVELGIYWRESHHGHVTDIINILMYLKAYIRATLRENYFGIFDQGRVKPG